MQSHVSKHKPSKSLKFNFPDGNTLFFLSLLFLRKGRRAIYFSSTLFLLFEKFLLSNVYQKNIFVYSSRMIEIQTQMCERAMELMLLPEDEPCFLLDLGCGSGLSGSVLEENGHYWVGVDISRAMLGEFFS